MTFKPRIVISILFSAAVLMLAGVAAATAVSYKLGDADGDGEVTIIDATYIQRRLADVDVSGAFSQQAADVDRNGEIEITDAVSVQRWLAMIPTPYSIGAEIEAPTEAPTAAPTATPTQAPTQLPTDEEGWGREIFRP